MTGFLLTLLVLAECAALAALAVVAYRRILPPPPSTARRRAADAHTGAIDASEIRRHLDAGTLPDDLSTLARKASGGVTRTLDGKQHPTPHPRTRKASR